MGPNRKSGGEINESAKEATMRATQTFMAIILGVLVLGPIVLGAVPASAGNMWFEQAMLLAHIPLGGGQFFTVNYAFASPYGATTVNVKCFNDASQRIGPVAGVNVLLSAIGQVVLQTPTTLQVVTDPAFTTGLGWCWGNGGTFPQYNVQVTAGITSDLTPGGILNSPTSTFVAANTGLAEAAGAGGIPYFTTSGGASNFLIVVNPLNVARTLSFTLWDANGIQQGPPLSRLLNAPGFQALSLPGAFGFSTPPTGGTIQITAPGFVATYLGWLISVYPVGNRLTFTAIGLDENQYFPLPAAAAP